MKILIVGKSKTLEDNLKKLDSNIEIVKQSEKLDINNVDGIIILEHTSGLKLKEVNRPIISKGYSSQLSEYTESDVVVFTEDQMSKEVGPLYKIESMDDLKKIMAFWSIDYLVITLGKNRFKKLYDEYKLKSINVSNVNVDKRTINKAEDIVIAIIAYIFFSTGELNKDAIVKANFGSVITLANKDNKDFKLRIKVRDE